MTFTTNFGLIKTHKILAIKSLLDFNPEQKYIPPVIPLMINKKIINVHWET